MEDKFKKKVMGLIDTIYLLYFMTGLFYCGKVFSSMPEPKGFAENLAVFLIMILNITLWLPMKIVELF